ncbi:MAG: uroporphyrinogen decarboxylase family protein, partial [Candidatus Zixiibacteriota bacterium]
MTARERLHKCIAGEDLDRPLVSAWRHFYNMETTSSGLAEAMVSFQKRFEWDFMKINPRASYHMEDWGNELEWSTDEFRKHTKVRFAVEEIDDWEKITVLKPTSPVLAETLEAIRLIRMGVGPDLPLLMTVFTPLSIAGDLVRSDQILLDHLTRDKPRVVAALERITETFESYVPELRKAGA